MTPPEPEPLVIRICGSVLAACFAMIGVIIVDEIVDAGEQRAWVVAGWVVPFAVAAFIFAWIVQRRG